MHVDDRIAITYNLDIPSSLSLSLPVSGSLRYYRSPSVSVGLSRSLFLRASSGSPPVLTGFLSGRFSHQRTHIHQWSSCPRFLHVHNLTGSWPVPDCSSKSGVDRRWFTVHWCSLNVDVHSALFLSLLLFSLPSSLSFALHGCLSIAVCLFDMSLSLSASVYPRVCLCRPTRSSPVLYTGFAEHNVR